MLIENFVKLNRSSRSAVSAAVIGIAAIGMYLWIVSPRVAYLSASQQLDSTLDKTLEKNRVIIKKVEAKKKELQQLHEQFADRQNKLFTTNEAAEFSNDLEAAVNETGCTVYSLTFSTGEIFSENVLISKNEQREDTLYVATNNAILVVIGVYENIVRLVEKLQMRNQGVWIDSLQMEAFDDNSHRLKCDMTITIYTIQNKETALNE